MYEWAVGKEWRGVGCGENGWNHMLQFVMHS